MAEIKSLKLLSKAAPTTSDVLLVTNTATNIATKYTLTNLFPSLIHKGSGEKLFTSISSKNQLNFKGLRSGSSSKLSITTSSNDVIFSIIERGIDLNNCNNITSQFSRGVNFNKVVSGINGVANGGTGLSTVAKGGVMYATDLNTLAVAPIATNCQLLIGNTTNGYPSVGTLTAGANVTITNTPGAISIAASLSGLAAHLDCNAYGINLDHAAGRSWVSGDGTLEGVSVDADGKVVIGDSTPSVPSIDGQLNLIGAASTAISVGNVNDYKNHTIKAMTAPSGVAGLNLTLLGASASSGNNNGGAVDIKAGAATGSGIGGSISIYGGTSPSGTSGSIKMYTYSGGTPLSGLTLDNSQNVTIPAGNLVISTASKGLIHSNSGVVTQATNHGTAVTLNSTSGVITLAAVALAAATNAQFTFTNNTLKADSIILMTMQDENTTNNAQLTVSTNTVTAGSCIISVHNSAATGATSATASKIHFLIINKSV